MTIRPCRPGDLPGILALFHDAVRTARPFFEARGYRLLRAQTVERRGVSLENFVMKGEVV